MAEAGSHMYGLSTPTSDVDYIVVYKEPTEVWREGGGAWEGDREDVDREDRDCMDFLKRGFIVYHKYTT